MKNPLTPAVIEPATFRFVAQHVNHRATAVRWTGEGIFILCSQYRESINLLLEAFTLCPFYTSRMVINRHCMSV